MTDSPTTKTTEIDWMSLRGALRRSDRNQGSASDGGSGTAHVVDVIEPLSQGLREQLGTLGPNDLVVILSVGTRAEPPSKAEQYFLSVEEEIKQSTPAAWIVLRCSPFVQEFLGSVRSALNESIFAAWEEREVPWLDFADVIRVISVIAQDQERREKTYELTGAELSSPRQFTDILAEEFGLPFHYVLLGPEQMAIAMHRGGDSHEYAERRTQYMIMTTGPDMLPINETVRRATGREPGSARAVIRAQGRTAYEEALTRY